MAAHVPLDLGEKLVNAARTADLALLKRLLKSKSVDVDYVDASGYSALRLACLNGQASAVKVLLKAGATVDLRSCYSITALHVPLSNLECAELLIGAGARWTSPISTPRPHRSDSAANNNHRSIVRLLLDAKASTTLGVDGETPLEVARRTRPRRVRCDASKRRRERREAEAEEKMRREAKAEATTSKQPAEEDAMKAAGEAAERERRAAHVPSDLGEKLVDAVRTTDLALLKRLLCRSRSTSTT